LGALLALGMAANITLSILNVPHEWGWTYTMLLTFPALFLLTDAGRSFGLDAFLAPPLARAAARGHRLAGILRWLVSTPLTLGRRVAHPPATPDEGAHWVLGGNRPHQRVRPALSALLPAGRGRRPSRPRRRPAPGGARLDPIAESGCRRERRAPGL